MTSVHEIAFLVLGGALSCWTWPTADNLCPSADSIKLSAYEEPDLRTKPIKFIDRQSFNSYLNAEVGYEENGFAIFKIENSEWYQIMSNSGQVLWLHLPTVEKQFQSHHAASEKNGNTSSWRVEKIESLVGKGMARVAPEYLKYLRKEDLKTPLLLSKELFAKIHERQLNSRLEEIKTELPISYIEVSMPCTYKEISPGTKTGSCKPPPSINAYEKPDQSATSNIISMTWANWIGKSFIEPNQERTREHLYIFDKNNNWIKIQVAFGDPDNRTRWIKMNDLGAFKIYNLSQEERVAALIQLLESTNRSSTAQKIKELSTEPGFSVTGRTKWSSEGILWGEVNIQDFPACSAEEPKTLMKAWLPYKLNKKSPPILSWYSRGC